MRNVLIASYDMEVGGVERSLAGMLDEFDYSLYDIDLMLYRHKGDFMSLLSDKPNLLREIPQYATFRKSINETIKEKQLRISASRLLAKVHSAVVSKVKGIPEMGYFQMQLMWKYALPFLPECNKQYDVAISYLWPHYYVADKVRAEKKVAWIHTDYSTVVTNRQQDLKMWDKFDYIIAVSDACRDSFLESYKSLKNKVKVIENMISPDFVRALAKEEVLGNPMDNDLRFKLLSVGRLCHPKGFDQAIMAFKQLVDRGYNNLVWYVIGYGDDEAMLRALIAENKLEDQFVLLGKQTNPYPYMNKCDLYIQPSRYEGKAVTVTEAKILGKPIVITNYPTAPSQVQHEVDGYITDLSILGIATGIEKLFHDTTLRERLAANCVQTDYSNGNEMEKLYDLISTGGRSSR